MYHKISSQYGWDDEKIGELTVARFLQINATIDVTRYSDQRSEQARSANQFAVLARYIVNGYMAEAAEKQPVLDEVGAAFAFDPIDRAVAAERTAWLAKNSSGPVRSGGGMSGPEPRPGSFERVRGAFGGQVQGNGWADIDADQAIIQAKINEDFGIEPDAEEVSDHG